MIRPWNAVAVLLMLTLVSCTSGQKKNEEGTSPEGESTALESSEDDFLLEEDGTSDEDLFADLEEEESFDEGGGMESESEVEIGSSSEPAMETTGEIGEYTVESGDTYMIIAFKIYGDYERWREIQNMNPNVPATQLSAGTVIQYDRPAQEFVWNPQGNPYLIKDGDTLGSISNDKYGTPSKWRGIYENNQPMIKDPNLIFAGFTLYYIPDDRELASDTL